MLQLRLNTLQPLADLEYPSLDSRARVFNWVFSVPYEFAESTCFLPGTSALRFVLHLRLRRGIYAFAAVQRESRIVRHVSDILREHHLSGTVEAGLGWSDLIVNGIAPWDEFKNFSQALVRIHEAHFLDADRKPYSVFERTLTLIGYLPEAVAAVRGLRPILFARTEPGKLYEAATRLESALGLKPEQLRIVDGKSDLLALPARDGAPAEFLIRHRDFVAAEPSDSTIQRLETHVLVERPQLMDITVAPISEDAERLLAPTCTCERSPRMVFRPQAEPYRLPSELEHAIQNVRFLFKSVLRDETNCCDVHAAMRASERGLLRLGKQIAALNERLHAATTDDQARRHHQQLVDAHKQVELWSLLAERILRQRTIGSFEEILGQTDRALSYRGGVQKFLYLADALMNDFAMLVKATLLQRPEFLDGSRALPSMPIFASLYDTVPSIQSMRGTGLVRIPVKHLFKLPFVVPDLWHEVGAYFFFREHPIDKLLPEDDPTLPATHQRYLELADHYADLLVYLVGFRKNFSRFLTSLVRGSLDALSRGAIPAPIRVEKYCSILLRLYTVSEFEQWQDEDLSRAVFDSQTVNDIVKALDDVVRARFPGKIPEVEPEVFARVPATIRSHRFAAEQRVLIAQLYRCSAPKRRRSTRRSLFGGDLQGFGETTDLNALFGTFYWEREYRRMRNLSFDNRFRAMAALGRSATIEYHRRQNAML